MKTLLQTTNAYKILSSRSKRHHAYLLLYSDVNVESALKVFSCLFFPENERIETLIENGNFSDCVFLPEKGKKFTVETAEILSEEAALRPVEGAEKLFVLSDFSEATPQAQNKLLKILEEPPEGVYFLLCASNESAVLPTVRSRTEKLQIPPFSIENIVAFLKRNYPNSPRFEEVAALSGGYPAKAEQLLSGNVLTELTSAAFALVSAPEFSLPALIKKYGESGYKKELLSLLRMIYRDALFLKTGKASVYLLPSEKDKISSVSSRFSSAALIYAQECLQDAEKDVRFNATFSQTLELTLAKINRFNQDTVAP